MLDGEDIQHIHHSGKDGGGDIGIPEGPPAGAARPQWVAADPKPLPDITDPARTIPRGFYRHGRNIRVGHGGTITDRERAMKWVLAAWMMLVVPAIADTGWPHYGGDQGGGGPFPGAPVTPPPVRGPSPGPGLFNPGYT